MPLNVLHPYPGPGRRADVVALRTAPDEDGPCRLPPRTSSFGACSPVVPCRLVHCEGAESPHLPPEAAPHCGSARLPSWRGRQAACRFRSGQVCAVCRSCPVDDACFPTAAKHILHRLFHTSWRSRVPFHFSRFSQMRHFEKGSVKNSPEFRATLSFT